MSALAGIFKFDPRERANPLELMELARGIDRIGPDGGSEYLSENIGMAYRAFHTTPESYYENQPLVRDGCILTFDGRLDNRDDIRTKLDDKYEGRTPTDLDLVFAAYQRWSTGAFAELLGDWTIALWDQTEQRLFLARDYMGVRRLFYRVDDVGVTWCTIPEPLVLTASKKLHLDLNYLAGCFYPRPPIETTAYEEIRGVIPATFLAFSLGGRSKVERYWSLNPHARIRYSTDREYEEHFRMILLESVRKRLRSDSAVTAELSGGVDSSSIVCVADHICNAEARPPIETLSYYDSEEPSGDERHYFSIIEQARGRTGNHISMSDFSNQSRGTALKPLPKGYFVASPGYFAKSLEWQILIQRHLDRVGSRVVLSGLGGDELLGGVQYEAPELSEYLAHGRFISFARSLMAWSLARKKTALSLVRDVFQLVMAQHKPELMLDHSGISLPWLTLVPGRHAAFRSFTSWRQLSPVKLSLEGARYSLATQLSCSNPPLVGCIDKRYPYLDRSLFAFVASIPREQILQATHRRRLMRRALKGLVPEEVLLRKTKWFGSRAVQVFFVDYFETVDRMFKEPWLSDGWMFNAAGICKDFNDVAHGVSQSGMALRTAIGIELWLRLQVDQNRIELTDQRHSVIATQSQWRFPVALLRGGS
jgi:asparagine synthase (glutamine-hydrolysing)